MLLDKLRGIDERKWNLTKMYVEGLQFETKSLMSEAESGIGTEGTPSGFDVDIGGQYRKVIITNLSFCDNHNNNKTLFKHDKYLKPEVCGVVLQ